MGRRDAKAKEFWRDNGRFADFFNAVLFAGREVIRPGDLTELDTDVSAVVKGKRGYVNTVSEPGIWCGSLLTGRSLCCWAWKISRR